MWPYEVPGPGLDLNLNQILDQTLDMSQNKSTLQDLNARLSSYIHQVRRLESSNQALERQIEVELRRRSPGDLKHLDSKLRTTSDLQDQISVCIRECALLKLQSLGAEFSVSDLKARCAEVGAEREQLEAELSDLQLLWVELQERHLTDLNQEVFEKEAELQRLKSQHKEDVRGFQSCRAEFSVQLRSPTPNPCLSLQLQDGRFSGLTLPPLDWSLQAPHVKVEACAPPQDSELLQLKNTASGLQQELDLLRQETSSVESAALDHMGALEQLLSVSQLRAARLCEELQTTLDASEQQNERTQSLRGRVTALRAELQRYHELLQGANQSEDLLMKASQSTEMIRRTNQSEGLLQRTNQRTEPRVLSPGPIKTSSSPLKWTAPLTITPAPKGQRSIQAGQSVQRKTGFDPGLNQDQRAVAILSDSKHNTTIQRRDRIETSEQAKSAAKKSENKIGVSYDPKKEIKGERDVQERKAETKPNISSVKTVTEMKITESKTVQNLKTAQVESGAKLNKDVNKSSVHKMESKMMISEGLSPTSDVKNVSNSVVKNQEISKLEAVKVQTSQIEQDVSKTLAKTDQSLTNELKIQAKTTQKEDNKAAVHKMESKMERSEGGLAPMKSKEDNANHVSTAKTEKTEMCGKVVEIKSEVCGQNGGSVKLEDKMEDGERRIILNTEILKGENLENGLQIQVWKDEKKSCETQEDFSVATNVSKSVVKNYEEVLSGVAAISHQKEVGSSDEKKVKVEQAEGAFPSKDMSEWNQGSLERDLVKSGNEMSKEECDGVGGGGVMVQNEAKRDGKAAQNVVKSEVCGASSKLEAVEAQTSPSVFKTLAKTDQTLTNEFKIQEKTTHKEDIKDVAIEMKMPLCPNLNSQKLISNSEENIEISQKHVVEGLKEEQSQKSAKSEIQTVSEASPKPMSVDTRILRPESNITVVKIIEEIQKNVTRTNVTPQDTTEICDGKVQENSRKELRSSGDYGAKEEKKSVGELNLFGEDFKTKWQNSQVENLNKTSQESSTVEAENRHPESKIIIVKIIEEAQDSLSKTNVYNAERFELEDQKSEGDTAKAQNLEVGIVSEKSGAVGAEMNIEHSKTAEVTDPLNKMDTKSREVENMDLTSKLCNQIATEKLYRTVDIEGHLKDSSAQNLTAKEDKKSGRDTARVQNLEVGIVSEKSSKQIIVNSGTVGTEMNTEHSKTAEVTDRLKKMEAKKQEEQNVDLTSKIAAENLSVTVEFKGRPMERSAVNNDQKVKQDEVDFKTEPHIFKLEKGSEFSSKSYFVNSEIRETKTAADSGASVTQMSKSEGGFDSKIQEKKSKGVTVEPKIAQKIQASESQKSVMNVKKQMEISQNLVTREQEAEAKTETGKQEILAKFKDNEAKKLSASFTDYETLCSNFPTTNSGFEQYTEFPQNPALEAEFLRLNEDAFCPQDLEEWRRETEMDRSEEADFEDLTEANVRVRPVERYILKESPSFADSFSDLEENAAIQESLVIFGEDKREVPVCVSVPGSLQIYGAERVIAEKERESGFGGVYRAKGVRTCKQREEGGFGAEVLSGVAAISHQKEVSVSDEKKVKVEQAEAAFSSRDLNRWNQGSLERDLVKSGNETSKEERGGGGGVMVQNEAKRDGKADQNVVKSEVCGASSGRGLLMDKVREKNRSLTDVTRKNEGLKEEKGGGGAKCEGSFDIPLSPPASANVGSEWRVYGRSTGRMSTSPPQNQSLSPTNLSPIKTQSPKSLVPDLSPTKTQSSPVSSPVWAGRVGTLYCGKMVNREVDLVPRALSPGRFGKVDSGEWFVYGNRERISRRASESDDGSPGHLSQFSPRSPTGLSPMSPTARPMSPTSPPDPGRFRWTGSGEWRVYGQNQDHLSSGARPLSPSLPMSPTRPMSPAGPSDPGRFRRSGSADRQRGLSPSGRFKAGSAEFYVYGNRERISRAEREPSPGRSLSPEFFGRFSPDGFSPEGSPMPLSPLSPYSRFSPRAMSPGGLRDRSLSPDSGRGEWLVYRSLSPRREADGGHFGGRAQSPPAAGRLGKPNGKEWHVYKIGNADEKLRKRTLSPPEVQRKLFFTRSSDKSQGGVVRRSGSLEGGAKTPRLSGARGRSLVSSIGKFVSSEWRLGRSKSKGSKDAGNKELGSTGGRVITSSDGPIKSSGSGTGAKKERLSVCKMAAMSMSKDKVKKDTVAPPSVQLWLNTSDPSVRPEDSKP